VRYVVVSRSLDGISCKSRSFADYDEAKLEAESVAIAIHNGSLDSLELIGEKRRAHERAAAIVAELDRPLDGALIEFKEARDLLSKDVSLVEATRFYAVVSKNSNRRFHAAFR
jgi:hypothetical protein